MCYPPQSAIGTLPEEEREAGIQADPSMVRYQHAVDRERAYEMLAHRALEGKPRETKREDVYAIKKELERIGTAALRSASSAMSREIGRSAGRAVTQVISPVEKARSSRKQKTGSGAQ